MSTRIKLNVTGNQLAQRNKEEQLANRKSQLDKQIDDKFVADVRQIELAATTTLQREGAVPEYRIKEQTSAQRKEGGMGGWLDVNMVLQPFTPEADDSWITGDGIQFNVACGNGTKWATATFAPTYTGKTTQATLSGAGPVTYSCTLVGVVNGGTTNELPIGATVTPYNPVTYEIFDNFTNAALYFDPDSPSSPIAQNDVNFSRVTILSGFRSSEPRIANYLVYPVNDNTAIVVISAFLGFGRYDTTEIQASAPYAYGFLPANFIVGPGTAPGVSWTQYYQEIGPGAPGGPLWRIIIGWFRPLVPNTNDYITTVAGLNLPPPSPNFVRTFGSAREDFAFVVSQTNVRKINVPAALKEKLEIRYPAPTPSSNTSFAFYNDPPVPQGFIDYYAGNKYWQYSPVAMHMGAGISRTALLGDPAGNVYPFTDPLTQIYAPAHLFGSPGVYDYTDADFQDYDFIVNNGEWGFTEFPSGNWIDGTRFVVGSSNAPAGGVPLFAPDHTVNNSGYSYLESIFDYVFADIGISDSESANIGMLWLFLKPDERELASATYTAYGFVANDAPVDVFNNKAAPAANPQFYYSYFRSTPDGVTVDYKYRQGYSDFAYSWFSATTADRQTDGFMRTTSWEKASGSIRLSPARILPPSLFLNNPSRTQHPYFDLPFQTTVSTGPRAGQLSLIAWTGWGRNWTAKLTELGFSAADLKP